MKTVRISEDVWAEIAKRGQFGETVDDVLRRVFNISNRNNPNVSENNKTEFPRKRRHFATNKMSTQISQGRLIVEFASGERNEWPLPERDDKIKIRQVRKEAKEFAEKCGATEGQVNAIFKALTEENYHISR